MLKKLPLLLLFLGSALSYGQSSVLPFTYYQRYQYTDGAFTASETYFVDISDSGRICGYYKDAGGAMVGLVYLQSGKAITYSHPGYTNTEFTGINDSVYVIGRAYSSPTSAVPIRGRLVNGQITNVVEMSWFAPGTTSQTPKGLSNDNLVGGAYTASSGKKWLKYCNITPPAVISGADIFLIGSTQYNTFGQGVTKIGADYIVPGYVLNGVTYHPMLYKHNSADFDTFTRYTINGNIRNTRLHDINSNYYGAIMYQGTDGFWQGTVGYVNWANNLVYDFDFPFKGALGSAVLGINEHNDVVGWTKDGSNTIVAYYALCSENKIPEFEPATHAFPFANTKSVFFEQLPYMSEDPHLGAGSPALYPVVQHYVPSANGLSLFYLSAGERFPHWTHYVEAASEDSCYTLVNGIKQPRMDALNRWWHQSDTAFNGYCYGMSLFEAQHFTNPDLLMNRFANFIPTLDGDLSVYGVGGPSWDGIRLDVGALQLYQFSTQASGAQELKSYVSDRIEAQIPYSTMLAFDTMHYYMDRISEHLHQTGDGDSLYILNLRLRNVSSLEFGNHAVVPYKVSRYPSTSTLVDTVYTADPNAPGATIRFVINYNDEVIIGLDASDQVVYAVKYMVPFTTAGQMKIAKEAIMNKDADAPLAGTGLKTYGGIRKVFVEGACEYTMVNTANPAQIFQKSSTAITNDFPGIVQTWIMDQDSIPDGLHIDGPLSISTTLTACNGQSNWDYAYPGGNMIFSRSGTSAGETDMVLNADNEMSIANPDGTAHDVTLAAITINGQSESFVRIDSLSIAASDTAKLVATDYQHYTLTNGDQAGTYQLSVRYLAPDVLITRTLNPVPIGPNTNHYIVIQPQAGEPDKVIILVDQFGDGTIEDTIAVDGIPTDVAAPVPSTPHMYCYPNPATSNLTLGIAGANTGFNYRIVDPAGRVVATGMAGRPEAVVDAHAWAAGIYLAELRSASGEMLGRLRIVKK